MVAFRNGGRSPRLRSLVILLLVVSTIAAKDQNEANENIEEISLLSTREEGRHNLHDAIYGFPSMKSMSSSLGKVTGGLAKMANGISQLVSKGKCVEDCNGNGECKINKNIVVSGTANPYACFCKKGYIGISCATKLDQYLNWFTTKGKTKFPKCCNICPAQEEAPSDWDFMPKQLNPYNPEHCNVLFQSNMARNSQPQWCNRYSNFIELSVNETIAETSFLEVEQEASSFLETGRRQGRFLPYGKKKSKSSSSSSSSGDMEECCVHCSPKYIQSLRKQMETEKDQKATKRRHSSTSWVYQWGEPGFGGGTGGQPNLIPSNDGTSNTCCSVCPKRVPGAFSGRMKAGGIDARENIYDPSAFLETSSSETFFGGSSKSKKSTEKRLGGFYEGYGVLYENTGCCNACPSQYWLNARAANVDDPFAPKTAITYKERLLGSRGGYAENIKTMVGQAVDAVAKVFKTDSDGTLAKMGSNSATKASAMSTKIG